MQIPFSHFRSRSGKALGKVFDWQGGKLVKSQGALSEGRYRQLYAESLADFVSQLSQLSSAEALSLGLCPIAEANVVPAALLEPGSTRTIARTRAYFSFVSEPGVLFLDYDPLPGSRPLTPEELIALVRAAIPTLALVTIAHKASSSSCLQAPDGSEISGLRGQHLFILVDDARKIADYGRIIADRLWLAGHGYYRIAANGALQARTIFDLSVWQPERLIFSRAECRGGVQQNLPAFQIFPSSIEHLMGEVALHEDLLPPLSPEEQDRLSLLMREERERMRPEAIAARETWLTERALAVVGENAPKSTFSETRESMARALGENALPGELRLLSASGEHVRVADLLADRERWHGARFHDPVEPEYRGDGRIAVAILNGASPHIYSHAHGGIRYHLVANSPISALSDFADLTAPEVAPQARRRLQVIEASEFVDGPPVRWIIKGLIPAGALGMIFGPPGSAKSFFVLDLLWAICGKKPWLDLRTRPVRGVYVAAEGVAGLRKRLRAYEQHHRRPIGSIDLGVIGDTPDLHANEDRLLIEEIGATGGASIIVIDTLAQASAGADENSAEDMGPILRRCTNIIERTGATVILVHHSGKDASRGARGWSGMRGALDFEIRLAKEGQCFLAKVTKQKDGPDGQEFPFSLKGIFLGSDEDGDAVTSCVVQHMSSLPREPSRAQGKWQQRLVTLLEHCGPEAPMDRDELIAAALEDDGNGAVPRRDAIERALTQLCIKGITRVEGASVSLSSATNSSQNEIEWNADLSTHTHTSL